MGKFLSKVPNQKKAIRNVCSHEITSKTNETQVTPEDFDLDKQTQVSPGDFDLMVADIRVLQNNEEEVNSNPKAELAQTLQSPEDSTEISDLQNFDTGEHIKSNLEVETVEIAGNDREIPNESQITEDSPETDTIEHDESENLNLEVEIVEICENHEKIFKEIEISKYSPDADTVELDKSRNFNLEDETVEISGNYEEIPNEIEISEDFTVKLDVPEKSNLEDEIVEISGNHEEIPSEVEISEDLPDTRTAEHDKSVNSNLEFEIVEIIGNHEEIPNEIEISEILPEIVPVVKDDSKYVNSTGEVNKISRSHEKIRSTIEMPKHKLENMDTDFVTYAPSSNENEVFENSGPQYKNLRTPETVLFHMASGYSAKSDSEEEELERESEFSLAINGNRRFKVRRPTRSKKSIDKTINNSTDLSKILKFESKKTRRDFSNISSASVRPLQKSSQAISIESPSSSYSDASSRIEANFALPVVTVYAVHRPMIRSKKEATPQQKKQRSYSIEQEQRPSPREKMQVSTSGENIQELSSQEKMQGLSSQEKMQGLSSQEKMQGSSSQEKKQRSSSSAQKQGSTSREKMEPSSRPMMQPPSSRERILEGSSSAAGIQGEDEGEHDEGAEEEGKVARHTEEAEPSPTASMDAGNQEKRRQSSASEDSRMATRRRKHSSVSSKTPTIEKIQHRSRGDYLSDERMLNRVLFENRNGRVMRNVLNEYNERNPGSCPPLCPCPQPERCPAPWPKCSKISKVADGMICTMSDPCSCPCNVSVQTDATDDVYMNSEGGCCGTSPNAKNLRK